MNYQVLHDELVDDPLGRGYSSMTDAEAAADLNSDYRTRTRTHLSSAEIYEATDTTEFQGKTDVQKVYVRDIWGLGSDVDVQPDSKARTVYVQIFGGGSVTISNLSAVLRTDISRAEELALGSVTPGDVERARAYPGG